MNSGFDSDEFVRSMNDEIGIQINKAIVHRVAQKPTVLLINLEDITLDVIKNFLRSKQSSTWSIFSIGSADSLEKAAEWFKRELNLLYAYTYRPEEYKALFDDTSSLRRPRRI